MRENDGGGGGGGAGGLAAAAHGMDAGGCDSGDCYCAKVPRNASSFMMEEHHLDTRRRRQHHHPHQQQQQQHHRHHHHQLQQQQHQQQHDDSGTLIEQLQLLKQEKNALLRASLVKQPSSHSGGTSLGGGGCNNTRRTAAMAETQQQRYVDDHGEDIIPPMAMAAGGQRCSCSCNAASVLRGGGGDHLLSSGPVTPEDIGSHERRAAYQVLHPPRSRSCGEETGVQQARQGFASAAEGLGHGRPQFQGRQSSCAAAGLPTGRSTVNSHFRTSQERQHMEDHSPDVAAHVETSAQLQGGVDVGMHRMWSGFEVSGAASDEECGQGRVFHGFETVLPTPGHLGRQGFVSHSSMPMARHAANPSSSADSAGNARVSAVLKSSQCPIKGMLQEQSPDVPCQEDVIEQTGQGRLVSEGSITISNWHLIKLEDAKVGRQGDAGVAVGGWLIGNREKVRTSAVVERIDLRKVVTCDGVEVCLHGRINQEASVAGGFSLGLVKCFMGGFPFIWKNYVLTGLSSGKLSELSNNRKIDTSPFHAPPLDTHFFHTRPADADCSSLSCKPAEVILRTSAAQNVLEEEARMAADANSAQGAAHVDNNSTANQNGEMDVADFTDVSLPRATLEPQTPNAGGHEQDLTSVVLDEKDHVEIPSLTQRNRKHNRATVEPVRRSKRLALLHQGVLQEPANTSSSVKSSEQLKTPMKVECEEQVPHTERRERREPAEEIAAETLGICVENQKLPIRSRRWREPVEEAAAATVGISAENQRPVEEVAAGTLGISVENQKLPIRSQRWCEPVEEAAAETVGISEENQKPVEDAADGTVGIPAENQKLHIHNRRRREPVEEGAAGTVGISEENQRPVEEAAAGTVGIPAENQKRRIRSQRQCERVEEAAGGTVGISEENQKPMKEAAAGTVGISAENQKHRVHSRRRCEPVEEAAGGTVGISEENQKPVKEAAAGTVGISAENQKRRIHSRRRCEPVEEAAGGTVGISEENQKPVKEAAAGTVVISAENQKLRIRSQKRNSMLPPPLPAPRVPDKSKVPEAFGLKTSRSGRILVPPLAYWRSQSIGYDKDGGIIAIFDGFKGTAADTGCFTFKAPQEEQARRIQKKLCGAAVNVLVTAESKTGKRRLRSRGHS